jgi:hypothetical protein
MLGFWNNGISNLANQHEFRVLVMGLLGPSLTQLQDEQNGYKFKIGTVLRIGLQVIRVCCLQSAR